MLANGTLWTKDMEMRLTDNDVVLLDGETQVSIKPPKQACCRLLKTEDNLM